MIKGKRKAFHDQSRLKEFIITMPSLQRIVEEYFRLKRNMSIVKRLQGKISNARSVVKQRKTKK